MKTLSGKILKGLVKTPEIWESIIQGSVHFVLPEGGKLLNDKLIHLENILVLPYPRITISFMKDGLEYFIVAIEDDSSDEILITSFLGDQGRYSAHPVGIWVDKHRNDSESIDTHFVVVNEELLEFTRDRVNMEDLEQSALASVFSLLELLEALVFKNTVIVNEGETNETVNKKRLSKGKSLLFQSKTVRINTSIRLVRNKINKVESRKSPEPHTRMAHLRRLANGKEIEIKSMSIKGGNVPKEYFVV